MENDNKPNKTFKRIPIIIAIAFFITAAAFSMMFMNKSSPGEMSDNSDTEGSSKSEVEQEVEYGDDLKEGKFTISTEDGEEEVSFVDLDPKVDTENIGKTKHQIEIKKKKYEVTVNVTDKETSEGSNSDKNPNANNNPDSNIVADSNVDGDSSSANPVPKPDPEGGAVADTGLLPKPVSSVPSGSKIIDKGRSYTEYSLNSNLSKLSDQAVITTVGVSITSQGELMVTVAGMDNDGQMFVGSMSHSSDWIKYSFQMPKITNEDFDKINSISSQFLIAYGN